MLSVEVASMMNGFRFLIDHTFFKFGVCVPKKCFKEVFVHSKCFKEMFVHSKCLNCLCKCFKDMFVHS